MALGDVHHKSSNSVILYSLITVCKQNSFEVLPHQVKLYRTPSLIDLFIQGGWSSWKQLDLRQ